MDKQKSTLLDAYVRKAIALGKLGIIEHLENHQNIASVTNIEAFNKIYTEVNKFIDCTDLKVRNFLSRIKLPVNDMYPFILRRSSIYRCGMHL